MTHPTRVCGGGWRGCSHVGPWLQELGAQDLRLEGSFSPAHPLKQCLPPWALPSSSPLLPLPSVPTRLLLTPPHVPCV